VVVQVEATMESEQLKLLGRSVAPIDGVVADAGAAGLRIFVEDQAAIRSVAHVLADAQGRVKAGGRGPILFCLMDPSLPGEIEIDTQQEFTVTPQIRGAIKSLPGVVEVEEV
jgi:DNA polymerase-3 subunit alpha